MQSATDLRGQNVKTSAQKLVCYLNGLMDAGVSIGHEDHTYPLMLRGDVVRLMENAAQRDENPPPEGTDPFSKDGKWHRAAVVVMRELDDEAKRMTASYEWPEGLPWGDYMHKAILDAMKSHLGRD